MALALHNNPDVRAAEQRLEEARTAIAQAAIDLGPILRLSGGFTAVDRPSQAFGLLLDQKRFGDLGGAAGIGDPGVTSSWSTGISGSLSLYDGGRRWARLQGRIAGAQGAAARVEEIERDLALSVARAFVLYHKSLETARAQNLSVETLTTHLRITEARQAAGAARASDVLAVRVRLAETREAAIVARNSAERALASLRLLLGLELTQPLELLPGAPDPEALAPLEEQVERARRHRFEVAEAEAGVAAARSRWREALATYHPDLTVFGSFGFEDRDPFAFKYGNWAVGASLLYSLTDLIHAPYRVREATAAYEAALAARRKAELSVELEVKMARLDSEEAAARQEAAREAASLAEESLRLVEAEFQQGTATITRLLEAELALTQARTRLSAAAHDRSLAHVVTLHALGEYPAVPTTSGAETKPGPSSKEGSSP